MIAPLIANPPPKSLVLLVPAWHDTMAILSFEFDQLFMLLVPSLVFARNAGSSAIKFPNEPEFVL